MNRENTDTNTHLMSRDAAALLERVVVGGDLSKLSASERMQYYVALCTSVGLNPMTSPLSYIYLQGKLTLYANKGCAEQLRDLHDVQIEDIETKSYTEELEDFYEAKAHAINGKGRKDTDLGIVCLSGSRGQQRADLKLKAVTKAKRRVTLSLCGLGSVLDETELDMAPGAGTTVVDASGQKILFTEPEEDRPKLIQRAKMAVSRIEKEKVAAMKEEILGSADIKYELCDLAALVAFVQAAEDVRL